MDFFIKCPKNVKSFSDIVISIDHWEEPIRQDYKSKNQLLILGDIILPNGSTKEQIIDRFDNEETFQVIKELGGHFYLLLWKEELSSLEIYTSYGSILPVYYACYSNETIVSSSVNRLADVSDTSKKISKEFLIERLLFNYPVTNVSMLENIKRLKNNYTLVVGENCQVNKYFDNLELLNLEKKESTQDLIDLFIDTVYRYAPSTNYYISFTGGFDGRTLLSVLLGKQRELITTYSFGRTESSDVKIPKLQAKKLGVPYYPFDLTNHDYLDKSISFGEEMIVSSSAEANYTRAHYLWAVSKIQDDSKYILSGNFGSEVLRSPHMTGIQFSDIAYKIIVGESVESIVKHIFSTDLKFVFAGMSKSLLRDVIEQVYELDWAKYKTKDLNKKCYYFMLDEMLRRYFGPEIKAQAKYLYNRTPYYDFNFISELFKSKFSGLDSKFFEQNKIKRFKGQLLYANIIKRTNKELLHMTTGKGYKPIDLITLQGKLKITYSKLFGHKNEVKDPFSTKHIAEKNKNYYDSSLKFIKDLGFDVQNFEKLTNTHKATLSSIAKFISITGK